MTVTIRHMQERDIPRVGAIMVTAFNDVFRRHGYPEPFPSPDVGTSLAQGYRRLEPNECFTALRDGQIIGSGFIHLRGDTAGIGPITVDPIAQAKGAGRALMQAVIKAGGACPSLRLVQDAFNVASFPLYSRLGFEARETIVSLVGHHIQMDVPGEVEIRGWRAEDIEPIAELDAHLTGIARAQDIRFFHAQPPHIAAFIHGRLVGYLCFLRTGAGTFFGPAAATQPSVLRTLILSAAEHEPGKALRMRFPARHAALLRELLAGGFQVETLQTYMVRGAWQSPPGVELLALFPEAL